MPKINEIYYLNNPGCNIISLKNNNYIGKFIIKKITEEIELHSLYDILWIKKDDFDQELNKSIFLQSDSSEVYIKYLLTEDESLLKQLL